MAKAQQSEQFEIPDLRVLPITSLVPHEHADRKRVARLETRLRADGYLKNPPIVAPIPGTDQFVVLDGANRTRAISNIDCQHIIAQVVDYKGDGVQLLTWHHLITGRAPATFLQEIQAVQGLALHETSIQEARAQLASRNTLAYMVSPQQPSAVYTVNARAANAPDLTALLNALVDTYKGDPQVSIHRVGTDELDDLLDYYDEVSGLVVFPSYRPDDIMALATSGARVPTGITRHIISPRALRVNVPLSFLESTDSLEGKNRWWHEQTKRKLASNAIRLYQESTYLFDE